MLVVLVLLVSYIMVVDMSDAFKLTLDGVSLANVVGTIAGLLPDIAALLSIIWLGIQIYSHFKKKE